MPEILVSAHRSNTRIADTHVQLRLVEPACERDEPLALGQKYTFLYSYNLAGDLTKETYPSGNSVPVTYDGAERPQKIGGINGAKLYASAGYKPHGGLAWEWYANQVVPVYEYNQRLQSSIVYDTISNNGNYFQFADYPWNWGGANNNGDLWNASTASGNAVGWGALTWFQQNYSYDNLDRLTGATDYFASNGVAVAQAWARTFGYDQYGNMSVTSSTGVPFNGMTPYSGNGYNPYNSVTNRLLSLSYDPAGNANGIGSLSISYDAESRQAAVKDVSNAANPTYCYVYDGDGHRVQKGTADSNNNCVPSTVYVYDTFGKLGAEYSSGAAATVPCTTCYLSYDHLGSLRMVTDQNAKVVSWHDYVPFGEEIPGGWAGRSTQFGAGMDNLSQRFTGKERDGESGLDYFGARYYSGVLGRFTSVDQPFNDWNTADPQSWNLYSYVRNNPLKNIDPFGQDCVYAGNYSQTGTVGIQRGDCTHAGGVYVNGTIDTNSLTYNPGNGQLGFSYANGDTIGSGTIGNVQGPTDEQDWGPGSSNMRGAAQIGQAAPIGDALGTTLLYAFGLSPLKDLLDTDNDAKVKEAGWAPVTRKVAQKMRKRGWTEKEIQETLENKPGIPAMGKNGPATRYVNPTTGKSIVVDNATGEVFHVGGEGYTYTDFDLPTIPPEP